MREGNRFAATASVLLFLSACATQTRSGDSLGSAIDSIAEEARTRQSIPGLSIVVTRGGEVIHSKGYGTADREAGTPATPETVYQIGSISKQLTAAGILRLVERGALSLDDRAIDRLPELPAAWGEVRLRHLLHQTSGVPEFLFLPDFGEHSSDVDRPASELRALIVRQPLQFAPGERWSYSNSNYTLLAAVIERVSGMPYETFLEQEIFKPLALTSFHHCSPRPSAPHHARGYGLRNGSVLAAPPENMNWARGDGGLCANAKDLARWGRALATGRAVSPRSFQSMTTPAPLRDGTVPAYGFGLSLIDPDSRPKIAHHGAMSGYTGMLSFYPEEDLVIAVLANRGGLWADAIEKAIARQVLGLARPRVGTESLAGEESRRYEGTYDVGAFQVRIVERDGRLWIETPPPAPTSPLLSQGEGRFVAETDPDAIQLAFTLEGDRAERLVLSMAGMHWYGRRTAGPQK
jgi:D-alanyl-D-alanine carboxypeptidase